MHLNTAVFDSLRFDDKQIILNGLRLYIKTWENLADSEEQEGNSDLARGAKQNADKAKQLIDSITRPAFEVWKERSKEGFKINFPNGVTVSVAWGDGNYSTLTTAEIAIWNTETGNYLDIEGKRATDQHAVQGWLPPSDVIQTLKLASEIEL